MFGIPGKMRGLQDSSAVARMPFGWIPFGGTTYILYTPYIHQLAESQLVECQKRKKEKEIKMEKKIKKKKKRKRKWKRNGNGKGKKGKKAIVKVIEKERKSANGEITGLRAGP